MRDALIVTSRPHASAIDDRRNVIIILALVQGDDQQTIVRRRPVRIIFPR
jgi:hypothetical protein